MKVLLVTPDFPPAPGGIQLLMARLVEHGPGWDATVVAPHPAGAGGRPGLRVVRSPRLPVQPATVTALNAVAVAAALRRRPDAIISAHVVASPAARLAARSLGRPWVQYAHGKELAARPRLAGAAVRAATATIAVSTWTAAYVERLGAPPERVHRILPGSDDLPARSGAQRPPPTIITVARLEDTYKGFDVMLRALPLVAARVPDVRWTVIGDGPLRREIERTAAAWNIGHLLDLRGRCSDAERDAALAGASVFAMPSRLSPSGAGEGFGIVYLEAARHGLPAVAGRAGGSVDAVRDGETGLLVDPEDHLDVAAALTRLLTDGALAARLGRAGVAWARERSWAQMASEVDALIRRLVRGSPR